MFLHQISGGYRRRMSDSKSPQISVDGRKIYLSMRDFKKIYILYEFRYYYSFKIILILKTKEKSGTHFYCTNDFSMTQQCFQARRENTKDIYQLLFVLHFVVIFSFELSLVFHVLFNTWKTKKNSIKYSSCETSFLKCLKSYGLFCIWQLVFCNFNISSQVQ